MLTEYHFEIEHINGLNNTRANALSRKKELQRNDKMLGAMLKLNKDRKIRYNHPQLLGTHKSPINNWTTKI